MSNKRLLSAASLAALVLAGLALSGCVVVPSRGYGYYGGGRGYEQEAVVVSPGIWVEGYWGWDGGRRRWYDGHYDRGDRGNRGGRGDHDGRGGGGRGH